MQITLKQTEISEGLKMYVQRQGLNLAGKSVDIDFTAGRGDAGLTATLQIEEITLPDLQQTDLDFSENRQSLKAVAGTAVSGQAKINQTAAVAGDAPEDVAADPAASPEGGEAVEAKPKASLFG